MPERSLGAAWHLMRRTVPIGLWRVGVTFGCLLAAQGLFLLGWRLAMSVGLWSWAAVLLSCGVVLVVAVLLSPLWMVYVTIPTLVAFGLVLSGASLAPGWGQVRQMHRVAEDRGGGSLVHLFRRMRQAHRDIMGLVQGLAAYLPRPLAADTPVARAWLWALALPLSDLAAAEAVVQSEAKPALPALATHQVARSAEKAHSLVAVLVTWSGVAALGLVLSAALAGLACAVILGPAPWLVQLSVTLMGTLAIWMAFVVPFLTAWAAVLRQARWDPTPPSDPWLARLEASSDAYRALALWPGQKV